MLLLIDNYDSFTYNLYQYLSELGAEVVTVRNDKITLEEIEDMAPEGIIVSPGPSTPLQAGVSNDVIRHFGPRLPTLGVLPWAPVRRPRLRRHRGPCRGNSPRQDLHGPPQRPGSPYRAAQSLPGHPLSLAGWSILKPCPDTLEGNRLDR